MDAGLTYGIFLLSCGGLLYLLSHWENAKQKYARHFIVGSYALKALGFAGYLFVTRPYHLFAVQAVLGLAEAINAPAYNGLYTKNLTKGKFTLQWGLWDTTWYVAAGLGAIAGGIVAQTFGFRILFIVMISLSLLGLISASVLLHKTWRKKK